MLLFVNEENTFFFFFFFGNVRHNIPHLNNSHPSHTQNKKWVRPGCVVLNVFILFFPQVYGLREHEIVSQSG